MAPPIQNRIAPPQAGDSNVVSIHALRAHCATCSMRELCLPIGLSADAMRELDAMIATRRRLTKGQAIFRSGSAFAALYAIRSGSCKVTVPSDDGREQVVGFHIMGDIVGFDGIDRERHAGQATALEDTEVCEIPFDRLEELCQRLAPLQHNLSRLLSRELVHDKNLLLALGGMNAEQRVITLLLDLSNRYAQRGYSSTAFVLRMTRNEIGSYLGLTLETVSRSLSRLESDGLIQKAGKVITLVDRPGLMARIVPS
ncbi:MAG: fumarate/nitrate reduction transcriptional regulator Fnr [Casimicrobiaceae bacterium]